MQEATVETYRGAVNAWECDLFGHLNIAFYPERFAAASADLLERLGAVPRWRTRALDTRYLRELRAGETLILESFVLAAEGRSLRLAHAGVTPLGERATLAEHTLVLEGDAAITPAALPWEAFAPFDPPRGDGAIAAGRDRLRAGEVEDDLLLTAYVRRFSDACLIAIEAIGMTERYRREENRGFATFETRLALGEHPPEAGEGFCMTSAVAAIGTSSLRLVHTMRATRDGRMLARFHQAGVNFDLVARRGAPWPAALRVKAELLTLATP